MNNEYYRKVLGEILQGNQPEMEKLIEIHFSDGAEVEGVTRYSFESLRIGEAVQFLSDNWEYISPMYQ
jgi:hypothetical protein